MLIPKTCQPPPPRPTQNVCPATRSGAERCPAQSDCRLIQPTRRQLETTSLIYVSAKCLRFGSHEIPGISPFEGSWPLAGIKRRQGRYVDSDKTFQWLSQGFLTGSYVSCWHVSPHESAAMWNLYLNTSEGVAIRSTCSRLIDAVQPSQEQVCVAEVRYIDYRTEDFEERLHSNSLTPLVYKRRSFEHEKELRAIACRAFTTETPELGIKVAINITRLIEAVFVSPNAPYWFKPIVEDVITRFGFTFPVHQSDLATSPVY